MNLSNRFGFGRAKRDALAGDRPVEADDAIYLNDEAARNRREPITADAAIRTLYHLRDKKEREAYGSSWAEPKRPKGLLERLGFRRRAAADSFGEIRPPTAAPAPTPMVAPVRVVARKKKRDRGDFVVAALGLTLGLTCALFPWYIFFNQEKFGVREFVFEGRGSITPSTQLAYQPPLIRQPFSTGEVPKMELDFFPTATLPSEDERVRAVPASEQPFPSDLVNFSLVHVANGRAMIRDADGLWVVQPGSRLPDASQVASIEQRGGNWVLVTTLDRVIELER